MRTILATEAVVGYADTSAHVRTLCASLPKAPRRRLATAGFRMSGTHRPSLVGPLGTWDQQNLRRLALSERAEGGREADGGSQC